MKFELLRYRSQNVFQSKTAVSSLYCIQKMETPSDLKFWLLSGVLFLAVAINGLSDTLRSVVYPMIDKALNLTYTQYGILQGMVQFSYLVWAFAIATGVHYTGYKMGFIIACIISIVGYIATVYSNSFITVLIAQFFATCVLGALDDGPSSFAVLIFTKYPATLYCIMSGMYGMGAFIGPSFASWVHDHAPDSGYKGISLAMVIPIVIGIVVFALVPFYINYPAKKEEQEKTSKVSVLKYIGSPMVWYCSFLINMLANAERSILNWGTMYVVDVLHLPESMGTKLNSTFYFFFMIARFVGGFITDYVGPFTMEYIILPVGLIIYVVGFALKEKGLAVLPFVGFFVSLYWPTFIIAITRYWKDNSAAPISFILPIQSLIGMFVQMLLGVINDHFGPQYAFWCAVPFIVISFVMLLIFHYIVKRKEKREEALLSEDTQTTVLIK